MAPTIRLVALAVMAAFLAQPVLAAAVCWQQGSAIGSCANPCPMAEKAPASAPFKAKATEYVCCNISATEPAPLTLLAATPGASLTTAPAPVPLAGLSAPPATSEAALMESPPRAASLPLCLLNCVLLI